MRKQINKMKLENENLNEPLNSLDQMVEHLRQKYMFSSSGDAKCIYHLIEFYDKHK